MALALPGAAEALGLGEIHVNSGLNEPLAADIDILGATAEELSGITASIADRETFESFDVDRPAFLSSVAFKVARDSRGRAVLAIRSTDACTEPLLNMLVDIRWRGGELIRQYALLLDPPGFPAAGAVAEAVAGEHAIPPAPAGAPPAVSKQLGDGSKAMVRVAPAAEKASATGGGGPAVRKTVKVGAKATLRGVAWRVGSRSDADLKRMMIAIFRANPSAFEGNINRLRRGAVLTIPAGADVSMISVADADHEVSAQMRAWHASAQGAGPNKSVKSAVAAPASPSRESAVPNPPVTAGAESAAITPADAITGRRTAAESAAPSEAALDRRIQQLERRLDELRDQVDHEHDALVRAQARSSLPEQAPAAVAPWQPISGRAIGSSIAAVLALAAAAFGIHNWRRRQAPQSKLLPVERQNPAPIQAAAREPVAPSAPVGEERRAAEAKAHDAPPETHKSLTPSRAQAGERQWVADALVSHRSATEAREAANPEFTVDAESLEASYLLEGSGGGFGDTGIFGDSDETASLPATVELCVDDPSAVTMPMETVRIAEVPESIARGNAASENAMPATQRGVDAAKLDSNVPDLDFTAQHVQMPSALHENVGFKERRTSLVDALKIAMEREPHRQDLRMKLLETYYAAAATNRQGFLDIVQKIAHERASLGAGEWDKIAWMGRQIAADDDLFAPAAAQPNEEDVASCV
jgi:pilus assembly protein FimV